MTDASATRDSYYAACKDIGKEVDNEILAVLNCAIDTQVLDQNESCILRLHANKRNAQNEKYRRALLDEDAAILYRTLQNNNFVVGLDLGYNDIADDGAEMLSKLLQETHFLKVLILSYNNILEDGAKYLAKGLQMNETLEVLKVNGNKIGVKGGLAIAGALQVNQVLQELDISDTDMATDSCIAFSTVLNYNTALKILDISRPILHTSQVEIVIVQIANMLKVNKTLQELHLRKFCMNDSSAEVLAGQLCFNVGLKHLDLSCNRITRDGAGHFAKLLKKNTPLEVLNLAYNRMEDDGACAIAEALASSNTVLQKLVVCSNNIASRGLCALAMCIKRNISLTSIYIWGNHLKEPACKAFENLMSGAIPRLEEHLTDVKPYVVDNVTYLSRLSSPY